MKKISFRFKQHNIPKTFFFISGINAETIYATNNLLTAVVI